MTRKLGFLLMVGAALLLSLGTAHAHTVGKQAIVDTDAALDDLRAITMLFNSKIADIELVTTSDGVLAPDRGARHMQKLLSLLEQNVPVASGEALQDPASDWRKWNRRLGWPKITSKPTNDITIASNATQSITRVLQETEKPVLLICLGPLSNVSQALNRLSRPENAISRILFLGGPPDSEHPGWNTRRDRQAAKKVFALNIPISCIHSPTQDIPPVTRAMLSRMDDIDSEAADVLTALHQTKKVQRLIRESHLRMWDDLLPLYLAFPDLFRRKTRDWGAYVTLGDTEPEKVKERALQLLQPEVRLHLSEREPVILRNFPQHPRKFQEDVRPYSSRIIQRHGLEEWKVCLLTSELHRHLGTYSIVGAKMGLRAREILNAPLGDMEVVSLAGDEPPLSCLSDGLQVATGASLGRGSITVSDASPEPAAIFFSNGRQLKLKLKKQPAQEIRSGIQKAKEKFGGLNKDYFRHIRKKSLERWLELDRKEIFEATFL